MSEEILRALMELFALIVKQGGGLLPMEKEYVNDFLKKQLPLKSVDMYLQLFLESAGPVSEQEIMTEEGKPSSRDSVRALSICNTINQTLTLEQKVVVLIRCFELINSDRQYTPQRINILNTIAEVFRIPVGEFNAIWQFVREDHRDAFDNGAIKVFATGDEGHDGPFVAVLKTESTGLFFVRSFQSGRTQLNGLPVTDGRVYTFASGSSLTTPPDNTLYYSDIFSAFAAGQSVHRLTFVAEHVDYAFRDGAKAISDISFSADQGKIVGILGTSGSGKTTLLNILCGLIKPDSGDVRINGISVFSPDRVLDGVIGYVPQDDLLIEELTVYENLYYAASLCCGDRSHEDIVRVVDDTLHSLGLADKGGFRVGTPLNKVISGGQRKRLNIALELVREPSVLFLDEPTSGLSSRDSDNVMELMHDLARKGKLIITVVHQPSSDIFKSFDQVIILDQEGEMVYFGNPVESVIHFKTLDARINSDMGECPTCGTVNLEVLFNILENRVIDEFGRYTDKRRITPHEWSAAFRQRYPFFLPEEEKSLPHSTLKRPPIFKQLGLFLSRDMKSKLANRQYMLLTFLEAPVLGLILSYVIRYIADPSSSDYIFSENENIPVYIFMCVIVAMFLGLTISAGEIFRDRKILKREHFIHLSRGSYLMAKVTVLIIISALQTFLFLAVANPVLGIKGLFWSYWITMFITSVCANMIGLNISSALNSAITIYIVIPLLMIPMMVLSGAMFPFDKLNREIGNIDRVPLVAELMPTRWSYEALIVRQAKDNEYDKRIYDIRKKISIADFNTIYRIPGLRDILNDALTKANGSRKLILLRKEINRMAETGIAAPFPGADSITPELFSTALGRSLNGYLKKTNTELVIEGNNADNALDRYVSDNKRILSELYNEYHNEKLDEIVRKVYEKNKILEYGDRLIQNIDPIYLEPSPDRFYSFRCHFMAPVKKFCGITASTFVFNNLLMLLSVVILYLLLYYLVLMRIINGVENLMSQKR